MTFPYSNSDSTCRDYCDFSSPVNLTENATHVEHTFISCKWTSCTGNSGGGIYYQKSDSRATLTIKKGEFYSCEASPNRGGGIYAEGIDTATIEDCLFYGCIAEAGNDYGGGAIQLWNIQQPFAVERTTFISCESKNDGGAISAAYCPKWHETSIVDSLFIHCTVTNSIGSDGGSLMVWESSAAIGCSNTLFANSYSERGGGAVTQYIYTTANHSPFIHLFSFCFFKNNSAKSHPSNDVFFNDWKPTEPFLHCFSTTIENRICYYEGNNYHTDKDDWFPYGPLKTTKNLCGGSDKDCTEILQNSDIAKFCFCTGSYRNKRNYDKYNLSHRLMRILIIQILLYYSLKQININLIKTGITIVVI